MNLAQVRRKIVKLEPDLLGSPIAEQDSVMLSKAFFEGPEFKAITQPGTKYIVVGRRGTGKSATYFHLSTLYSGQPKTLVIQVAPSEDSLTAIRFHCAQIAKDYKQLRRMSRLLWNYAFLNEIASQLTSNYKTRKHIEGSSLAEVPLNWNSRAKTTLIDRMLRLLETLLPKTSKDPQEAYLFLQKELRADDIKISLCDILERNHVKVKILVDRMDEGWDEDSSSVGFLAGLLVALEPINQMPNCRVTTFLRDNIFRAIHQSDPEGPRILETGHIRLRWDREGLFSLICNRIKLKFGITDDSNHKVWNHLADRGIENRNGFLTCLGHTLYRPRDIIHLLNEAALDGMKRKQTKIILENISNASTSISEARLNDLTQEYRNIFPAIGWLTRAFSQRPNTFSISAAEQFLLENSLETADAQQIQDLKLLPTTNDRLMLLYKVGFLGILRDNQKRLLFCHDGSSSENFESINPREISLIIHPCYWKALSLEISEKLSLEDASQQIHDEYDVKLSESPYYRNQTIAELLGEISKIRDGNETAPAYEEWAYKTLEILTAGKLANLDLRANKNNPLRRDIVGTIVTTAGFWGRVNADYGVREMVFEVKNYTELSSEDFQQLNSYLGDEYGHLGIFVTKKEDDNLRKAEIEQIRAYGAKSERKYMLIISKETLLRCLRKLRNPDNHGYVDEQLGKQLDFYIRQVFQR